MPLDLTDDKSTLVQVMAWCRQATSHYLSQFWPRPCRHMASLGLHELKWVAVRYRDNKWPPGWHALLWKKNHLWNGPLPQWDDLFSVVRTMPNVVNSWSRNPSISVVTWSIPIWWKGWTTPYWTRYDSDKIGNIWGTFQYCIRCLIVKSHKVLNLRDWVVNCTDALKWIWQTTQQH